MKRNSIAPALFQATGHSSSRPQLAAIAGQDGRGRASQGTEPLKAVARSRIGKKPITGFFDPEVSRQIKRVALDQDKTMQDLIQEALNDLFRKYDLPPIA